MNTEEKVTLIGMTVIIFIAIIFLMSGCSIQTTSNEIDTDEELKYNTYTHTASKWYSSFLKECKEELIKKLPPKNKCTFSYKVDFFGYDSCSAKCILKNN